MIVCTNCYSNEVPNDARYCPFCGSMMPLRPIPQIIVEVSSDTQIVSNTIRERFVDLTVGRNVVSLMQHPYLRWGFKFKEREAVRCVDLQYFSPEKNVDASNMFAHCHGLVSLNLDGLRGARLVDCSSMFEGIPLEKLDITSLNTEYCRSFYRMFSLCSAEHLDLSNFNTINLEDARSMFWMMFNIKHLDLSSFRTPKLKKVGHMFFSCHDLETLNLSGIDFSHIDDYDRALFMFQKCNNLKKVIMRGCNGSSIRFVECALQESLVSAEIYV